MKKTTLVVLALAIALGGYVYYSEFRNVKEKPAEDAPKPLFTFSIDDVASMRVTRPGEAAPLVLESSADGWKLTSPVATRADRFAAESAVNSVVHASSSRSLPADPAKMKEFGLDPPAASVEIRTKNGQTQKLDLGGKDFSDQNVYARADGAKDVLLVPDSVFTGVTRPLGEIRDRAILQLASWSLTEMDTRTAKAKFRIEKKGEYWDMTDPRTAPADGDDAENLKNALSAERFADVVEEQALASALGKYGLSSPELTVHVRNEQGGEATLQVGKKDGTKYFARDAARPMVFHIEEAFAKKFMDLTYASLRSKRVLRAKADDFTGYTVRNEKTTLKVALSKDGKWMVEEPADRKGKEVAVTRMLDPLTNTRAAEVLDPPPANIAAKLAKPAVDLTFTGKDGVVTTVAISAKDGDAVYVRSSRYPAIFRFDGGFLLQFGFSAEEIAP